MILLENVCKSYQHKGLFFASQGKPKQVIQNVSLKLQKGESVGLVGINGAGKSTLIKLMLGIIKPDTGSISVNGESSLSYSKNTKMTLAAMFGQKSQLWWNIPVIDSLDIIASMYARSDLQVFKNWVERLEITDVYKKAPRFLSFGQRIRCELAATLLTEPAYLFLDEPFIGLDTVFKSKLLGILSDYQKATKATMLIASHDLDYLEEMVDRILILDHNQLAVDSTLKEIKNAYHSRLKVKVNFVDPVQAEELIQFNSINSIYPETNLILRSSSTKQVLLQIKQRSKLQVDFLYSFIKQNFACESVEFSQNHSIQDILEGLQFDSPDHQQKVWSDLQSDLAQTNSVLSKMILLTGVRTFTDKQLLNEKIMPYFFKEYTHVTDSHKTFLLSLLPAIYLHINPINKSKVWDLLLTAMTTTDSRHCATAIETGAVCLLLPGASDPDIHVKTLEIIQVYLNSDVKRLRANSYLSFLRLCEGDKFLPVLDLLINDSFLYSTFYYLFEILTLHPALTPPLKLGEGDKAVLLISLQKVLNLWLDNRINLSTTTINRLLLVIKHLKEPILVTS